MKCSRCKKEVEGWNDPTRRKHIPICNNCRIILIEDRNFALTEKEKQIQQERLRIYPY